jgi:hypothetical protein
LSKKQQPAVSDLRVRDITDARASVREVPVRSIAPAVIFVCEVDAPVRMVVNASSHGERASLLAWLRTNPDAHQLATAYSNSRTTYAGDDEDLEMVARGRAHEELLRRGEVLPIERGV